MAAPETHDWNLPVTVRGWGGAVSSESVFQVVSTEEDLCRKIVEVQTPSWLPRGAGCSYGDAALNDQGTLLRLQTPDSIELDTDNCRVRVGAGTCLRDLLEFLVPRGWWIPGVPGFLDVTAGGIAAVDAHGKDHLRFGSFGDQIEDLELTIADGSKLRLSRDSQGDLFSATIGGMGLTGHILGLTIRVQKLPSSWMWVEQRKAENLESIFSHFEELLDSHTHVTAWIDGLKTGKFSGRGIIRGASFASPGDLKSHSPEDVHRWLPPRRMPVVPLLSKIFSTRNIGNFNSLKWNLSGSERRVLRPLGKELFPLEVLRDWNRLYGAGGLFQHQCVLPTPIARQGCAEILGALHDAGTPPYLVVLKRMGSGNFPLSFPIDGWTLSCDVAASSSSESALRALDERVAALGGRVYLAKDSTLTPQLFEMMYPRLDEFREIRQGVDPGGKLASDLARRLKI